MNPSSSFSPTPDALPRIDLAGRAVGPGHPALVIAEIGVNHDGRPEVALALVEAAARAGADAVKLQLFTADRLLHASAARAGTAKYQRDNCGATDPVTMLRRYELDDAAVADVVAAAREAGLLPLATPFSPYDVERIARLGLPAVKLASPDLVNPLLTDAAGALGLPLLLSTGAATQAEIDWAVARLRGRGTPFALLHCVSAYPTPPALARIAAVRDLRLRHGTVVGYSDHTQHLAAGAVAVAAGASIVEKHLTHDRAAVGPDHAASADPDQFAAYVAHLRSAESLLGIGPGAAEAETTDVQADVRRLSRQSLVAARDIPPGRPIVREDLTCQRPGTGLPAAELDRVVGRPALSHIPAGTMLGVAHLAA